MRIFKFVSLFILIVGNVLLLVNIDTIFNPKKVEVPDRKFTFQDSLMIYWDLKGESDKCRADILEFVQKRDISACRSHSGWNKYLSPNERVMVENLLCLDKHDSEAKRRIQEYLNGKECRSWQDLKEANFQVEHILEQYEKDREIARQEILNIVRKSINDTRSMKRTSFYRKEMIHDCRNHPGWNKYLTNNERYAVEAIYKAFQRKGYREEKMYDFLRSRTINSWEDILEIRKEIVKLESGEEKEIVKTKKSEEAKARAEILKLVQQKDLNACRSHSGWKYLTKSERFGIEAILDLNRYKGIEKLKVRHLINEHKINSWEDIERVRMEIIECLHKSK